VRRQVLLHWTLLLQAQRQRRAQVLTAMGVRRLFAIAVGEEMEILTAYGPFRKVESED
jgi:hypothetical protein